MDEHAQGLKDLRAAVVHLEGRMDRRFECVDVRFTAVDARFTRLGERIDRCFEPAYDARFRALEGRLTRRFDSLEASIGRLRTIVMAMAASIIAVGGIAIALLR